MFEKKTLQDKIFPDAIERELLRVIKEFEENGVLEGYRYVKFIIIEYFDYDSAHDDVYMGVYYNPMTSRIEITYNEVIEGYRSKFRGSDEGSYQIVVPDLKDLNVKELTERIVQLLKVFTKQI